MTTQQMRFDFVPTDLAVSAMRDNGYKNAAYAVAELIDNSIQAGASTVELLCVETEEQLVRRRRRRIKQIAVLDNGSGMDSDRLRTALQFGNGAYLNDRTGMGRFGMGLPSASISQCRRVDVWSWQHGPESALYTYLDLGEIERRELTEVPVPEIKPIPQIWRSMGQSFSHSGTLVIWENIDRCLWRTAGAIIDNSELTIGRMYRKFISDGRVVIRLASFVDGNFAPERDNVAKANDPLYLMTNTSTPPPYDNAPMFTPYGDHWEARPRIRFNGEDHEVVIRFTIASTEARTPSSSGQLAGSLLHGKHAAKNVGISVMRAGRELELDQTWVDSSDPRERWWGIEVEFPPSLDEIFGVTNNKQTARYFSQTIDIEALLDGGKSISELKEELRIDDDPRGPLLDIAETIRRNVRQMKNLLRVQGHHIENRSRRRYGSDSPEVRGTQVVRTRQADGLRGASDQDETLPAEERQQSIESELIERGVPETQARELAARTVSSGIKYIFTHGEIETPAFFSVRTRGGALIITLNTSHPAYKHLMEILDDSDIEELTEEVLRSRLTNAWRGLRLLLEAWARYEDEQIDGPPRQRVQDSRSDWGRVARQFLEEE